MVTMVTGESDGLRS